MADRAIEEHTAIWSGIALRIRFERDWLNASRQKGYTNSLLEIDSVSGESLPIAAVGWRKQFLFPEDVDRAGGPVAYALDWLDRAALDKKWIRRQETPEQPKLF